MCDLLFETSSSSLDDHLKSKLIESNLNPINQTNPYFISSNWIVNGLSVILKTTKSPVIRCSLVRKVNDSYLTLSKHSSSLSKKTDDSVATKSSEQLPATETNLPVKKLPITPFLGSTSVGEFVVARSDDLVNWARRGSLWPLTFGGMPDFRFILIYFNQFPVLN